MSLFQGILLSVFLQLFVLLAPFFMQLVFDEAIINSDLKLLSIIVLSFGLLKILEFIVDLVRKFVLQLLGGLISYDLKASVFHHLIRLPVSFFVHRGTGDVLQRFNSVKSVSRFIVDGLIIIHQNPGALRAGEFRRWGNALTQHFSYLGTRQ